jgi:lipopolysaccharide heptosyltransferase II
MQKQEEWNKFKNILCIRPDNMGDVLMTSPAIRALKNSSEGRKITLLASSAGSSIAEFIPEIDDIIVFDTPWEKNFQVHSHTPVHFISKKILKRNFDAAIIFNVYSQNPLPSAMLCYLSGITRVAGYCRENPYSLITDWIPDKEPLTEIKHEVQRQLDLVSHLGAISDDDSFSLKISESTQSDIFMKMKNFGINLNDKTIIIHPGVSELKRQFPVEQFVKAAKLLSKDLGYQLVITGLGSEEHLANTIEGCCEEKIFNLAGKLSLEELIALIKNAALLISNNTGPAHIASAVNTPVVVLYALTNPQHTPWKVSHRILPFEISKEMSSQNVIIQYANQKSFKEHYETVTPEKILEAVKDLLLGEISLNKDGHQYL